MENEGQRPSQEQPMEQQKRPPAREPGICDQCGKEDMLWRLVYQQEGGRVERLCDACFRALVSPSLYHTIRAIRASQEEP